MSSDTRAPYPISNGSGDVKINITRLGVIIAFLAALIAFANAWLVLPSRVEATERTATEFAIRVERRFEATEAEQRQQREILIRIDENVKQLKAASPR